MPQLNNITLTYNAEPIVYKVTGNANQVAAWSFNANGSFMSANTLSVGIRASNARQSTRKATLQLLEPLVTECPKTCEVTSRGVINMRLESVAGVGSTLEERTAAYDKFVLFLQDAAVRASVINNETFYS